MQPSHREFHTEEAGVMVLASQEMEAMRKNVTVQRFHV